MSQGGRGAPPGRTAVIGAGTMGAGIALCFALSGSSVRLVSRRAESLARARGQIDAALAQLAAHDHVRPEDADAARDRIGLGTDAAAAVEDADLVIESVVEDLDLKRRLLQELESHCRADAVLTTNTSSLSPRALAEVLREPERFAAFHWFNPAELVPLVEVVATPLTAPGTIERLAGWARAAGKVPVVLQREIEGFIANRLQYALLREAYALVESGICDYEAVDTAVTAGLGARWAAIGPFETMDLAGLDVHASVARELFPRLSTAGDVPPALSDAVAAGRLGVKTGSGLRGGYDDDAVARLATRRAETLLTLAALRRGA